MSDPGNIQVVDDGIHSVSKEGNGVYAVRQRSLLPDDLAEKGVEGLDERDIRKKQVLQHFRIVLTVSAEDFQAIQWSGALLVYSFSLLQYRVSMTDFDF